MDEHFGTTDIFHNYWQLKFLIWFGRWRKKIMYLM